MAHRAHLFKYHNYLGERWLSVSMSGTQLYKVTQTESEDHLLPRLTSKEKMVMLILLDAIAWSFVTDTQQENIVCVKIMK